MWIMLIETTASARVSGQTGAEASSSSGGSRFGEFRRGRVRGNAGAGLLVRIGRLPNEMSQSAGEMHCVLAGSAGELQHGSGLRQHVTQYSEDRIAITRRRWRCESAVGRGRSAKGVAK